MWFLDAWSKIAVKLHFSRPPQQLANSTNPELPSSHLDTHFASATAYVVYLDELTGRREPSKPFLKNDNGHIPKMIVPRHSSQKLQTTKTSTNGRVDDGTPHTRYSRRRPHIIGELLNYVIDECPFRSNRHRIESRESRLESARATLCVVPVKSAFYSLPLVPEKMWCDMYIRGRVQRRRTVCSDLSLQ